MSMPSAIIEEVQRPDIMERLTYHALERDDMTIDDLLKTLSKDGYRNVHQRTHRQLELQLLALLAGQAAFDTAPTDISRRLREYADNPGYSHNDYADVMRIAADECERFYGGMMAWKKTAQKKDADWQAERMGRMDDRIAARATTANPGDQPIIGKLLDEISQLQPLWGLNEPGALLRFSDVSNVLFSAARKMQTSSALLDVFLERRRQVEQEGYDGEHDDEHLNEEIAAFAAFYAMPPAARQWPAAETGYGDTLGQAMVPEGWTIPPDGDRRRELVKAGALILAEIERLDRASGTQQDLRGALDDHN